MKPMASKSANGKGPATPHARRAGLGLLAGALLSGAGCLSPEALTVGGGGSPLPPGPATTATATGTATTPAGASTIGRDDLVGYWSFDDGNGARVADMSGNHHDGTVLGATPAPGVLGMGMAFTGYGSGVDIEDGPDFALTDAFTIEAWFNASELHDGHNLIFFRGDGRPGLDPYFVTIYPDRTLRFAIQNEANDIAWATAPVTLGQLHQVVAVFDRRAAAIELYLDGQIRTTTGTSITPLRLLDSSADPGIGIGHHAMRTGNDYGFIGTIDEVRLYRRPLDASEVADHFSGARAGGSAIR